MGGWGRGLHLKVSAKLIVYFNDTLQGPHDNFSAYDQTKWLTPVYEVIALVQSFMQWQVFFEDFGKFGDIGPAILPLCS